MIDLKRARLPPGDEYFRLLSQFNFRGPSPAQVDDTLLRRLILITAFYVFAKTNILVP